MKDHITVRQDNAVPVGKCVITVNDVVAYIGRISVPMIPFMTEDATLSLNPVDFADGENFRKNVWGKLN